MRYYDSQHLDGKLNKVTDWHLPLKIFRIFMCEQGLSRLITICINNAKFAKTSVNAKPFLVRTNGDGDDGVFSAQLAKLKPPKSITGES